MTVCAAVIAWLVGAGVTYLLADLVIREGADEAQWLCCPLLPFWPAILVVCFVDSLAAVAGWLTDTSVHMPPNPDDFMR